jgi:hypothetical protein
MVKLKHVFLQLPILENLKKQGHSISVEDLKFLENKQHQYMQQLEVLDE